METAAGKLPAQDRRWGTACRNGMKRVRSAPEGWIKERVYYGTYREEVTVFGSFVVDLMGRTPHLPAAGETVKGTVFKMGPGGKGFNQGVAAHKAGADVTMVTKLGQDAFADIASIL